MSRPKILEMSLLNFHLDPDLGATLSRIAALLNGDLSSVGPADVGLPEDFSFQGERREDHFLIEWSPPIEADIFGPIDPDLLRARVYRDRVILDLRLSSLTIHF